MPSQIVLYAAKSTEDKRGSIETQLADCRAFAEHEGWQVAAEYRDEGFSAYKGNRGPGLEAAKQHAAKLAAEHGSSALVVQHSDRLARGAGDKSDAADHLGEIFFAMRRQGVRLRSVQDDSNLEDVLRAVLVGERNYEDSHRKSGAVADGKRRSFERGEFPGGPVPDGYVRRVTVDERGNASRHFELDPERAPIIRRAFQLALEGSAPETIARQLNREGYRAGKRRGFSRRRIQDSLSNPFYAGLAAYQRGTPHEETRPGHWEALVSLEDFARVKELTRKRDRTYDSREHGGRRTTRYALARLAVCERCGETMYCSTSPYKRKDGTHRRTYLCGNVHKGTGLCDAPRIDAEVVDSAVVAHLSSLFIDFDAWLSELAEHANHEREGLERSLQATRETLARAERRVANLQGKYADNPDDEAVADAYNRFRAEADDARGRAQELEGQIEALSEEAQRDAALDAYNGLRKALSGVLGEGTELEALNERLRDVFQRFELAIVEADDRKAVAILPVLQPDAIERYGGPELRVVIGDEVHTPTNAGADDQPVVLFATGDELIRHPGEKVNVAALLRAVEPPVKAAQLAAPFQE